jgi:hypothetical protein
VKLYVSVTSTCHRSLPSSRSSANTSASNHSVSVAVGVRVRSASARDVSVAGSAFSFRVTTYRASAVAAGDAASGNSVSTRHAGSPPARSRATTPAPDSR